jgi:hypothetical protein
MLLSIESKLLHFLIFDCIFNALSLTTRVPDVPFPGGPVIGKNQLSKQADRFRPLRTCMEGSKARACCQESVRETGFGKSAIGSV